jgi:hypothetical protein
MPSERTNIIDPIANSFFISTSSFNAILTHHGGVFCTIAVAIQETKPPIVRTVSPKIKPIYRVTLDTTGGETAHYEYTMRIVPFSSRPLAAPQGKVPQAKKAKPAAQPIDRAVQFVLTALHAQYGDKSVQQGDFGVVPLYFPESGLPLGLTFKGERLTAFILPLISWYLPPAGAEPDKSFDLEKDTIDDVLEVSGSGVFHAPEDGKEDLSLEIDFQINGVDYIKKRRLVLAISLDSTDGEVLSANGNYSAPDGTVSFRVSRAD